MNPEVKKEIVKRLKMQLCDVNRDIRNYTGDMATDPRFESLVITRAELKSKIEALK